MNIYEKGVQGQLEAYNQHDINKFISYYHKDVEVYNNNNLQYCGVENIYKRYRSLFSNRYLHCKLLNRISMGKTIIDYEEITFGGETPLNYLIAIYSIDKDGMIAKVNFLREES